MDKHYGWQEGRGTQNPPGRAQNGQRWNERFRDDRETRGGRGGESGWDDDSRYGNRERFSSGADLDRDDHNYEAPDDSFGSPRHGQWGQPRWQGEQGRGSPGDYGRGREFGGPSANRSYRNEPFRGQGSNQGFSGGHYGGFANEGHAGQGGYGGRPAWNQGGFGNEGFSAGGNYGSSRGLSNTGFSGQEYGQGSGARGGESWNQSWGQGSREFQSGQRQNFGQTFGQGHAGAGSASQGYGGQYGAGYGQGTYGQGYAGRGPKGYQRSDDRIKEQVSDRLMDDDDIDATEIIVEVKAGEVTLTGTVNSRHEKRAAEDAAEQTPGVREVQNHLRVQPQDQFSGRSASGQPGQSQWGSSSGPPASGTGRQDSFSKSQDSSSQSGSKSKSTERE